MKRKLFIFVIGCLFLIMAALTQFPYLALGMDKETIVKTAVGNTLMSTSYEINGSFELTEVESLPIKLQFIGAVDKNRKYFQIRTELIPGGELLGYYQEGEDNILITPIKGYEMLLYKGELGEANNLISKEMMTQLRDLLTPTSVEENKTLYIQEAQQTGFFIYVDQYNINLTKEQLSAFIKNKQLSVLMNAQVSEVKPIQLRVFIDRELQVRRIEGCIPLQSKTISIELNLNDFDKKQDISMPDVTQAIQLKGSIIQILEQFLEKQVPLK